MDRRRSRWTAAFTIILLGVLASPSAGSAIGPGRPDPASVTSRAHDEHRWLERAPRTQSASPEGATPEILDNFEVVGHLQLGGKASDADVAYFDHGEGVGQFAYIGTWLDVCSRRGVKIVDVTDPADPELAAVARLDLEDVSYEDPVVISIGARTILGVGVQICGRDGRGGLGLFDVSDPGHPSVLSFFETPSGGVHELDLTTLPDGREAALLAVPYGELSGGSDFSIVDISRPRHPVAIAGWGVIEDGDLPIPNVTDPPSETPEVTTCCQGIGVGFADFFFHSARSADAGSTAYVSHWDLGILKFDLADPSHPTLIGRTVYPFDADGEGHSMAPYDAGGVRYILQNDEDIEVLSPAHVRSSATGGTTWAAVDEPWMPMPLLETGPIEAEVHDATLGCSAADYVGAEGKIALANVRDPFQGGNVPCGLGTRILHAAEAGAAAFVFNFVSPDRPAGWYQPGSRAMERIDEEAAGMPVIGVASIDGLARAVRDAQEPVTMTLEPGTPEFGFLRVFSEASGTDQDGDGVVEYAQVGEFAGLPHVRGEFPPAVGDWTIHNTEVWGDHAFSSWYSHGIVALDLSNPADPTLVGQFAPAGDQGRESPFLSDEVPYVWGVALDPTRGLVYASDMRSGLWILRPIGDALPATP